MSEVRGFIVDTSWRRNGYLDYGWGNGYVLLPPFHKFHGCSYNLADEHFDVHGGFTFSELVTEELVEKVEELTLDDVGFWMLGFDTRHFEDNLETCPKEFVQYEVNRIVEFFSKEYF
jgi:hypothetical protein